MRRLATIGSGAAMACLALAGCVGDDAPAGTSTVPAASPSTAPVGFQAPPRCSDGSTDLSIWTAAVRIDTRAATADAVVRIENLGSAACELELAQNGQQSPLVEPNVVIDPGGWAELVLGQSGQECRSPEVHTLADLAIGEVELEVPTTAVSTCGVLYTEFLPAEHPTEPCAAADLTAVVVTGGVAIRNDGHRGCIVGDVVAVTGVVDASIPAADRESLGPPIVALAPFDVALLPGAALDECVAAAEAVTLQFSSGLLVRVPATGCVGASPGPLRAYYGSPDGPLTSADPDADPVEWVRSLDPFGDPCATVPVAPPDLVDGAPILSPPVVSDQPAGRWATWGEATAANHVTQVLDAEVTDESFAPAAGATVVEGPTRTAAVVPVGDLVRVDVADTDVLGDDSCVRRYELGPGVDLDAALAAAERWVVA